MLFWGGREVVRSPAFSKLAAFHIPIYTLEQLKSDNNVDCGRSYDVHAKKKNGDKFSYFNHLVSAACAKRGKEYSPICV